MEFLRKMLRRWFGKPALTPPASTRLVLAPVYVERD
jgi:hypothetical protein